MTTDLHHLFIGAIVQLLRPVPVQPRGADRRRRASWPCRRWRARSRWACSWPRRWWCSRSIFNLAAGLVGRVMPQFQVFFVATPLIGAVGPVDLRRSAWACIGMVWANRYRELSRWCSASMAEGNGTAASKTEEPTPRSSPGRAQEGRRRQDRRTSPAGLAGRGRSAVLVIGGGWLARDLVMPSCCRSSPTPEDMDVEGGGLMLVGQQATMAARPGVADGPVRRRGRRLRGQRLSDRPDLDRREGQARLRIPAIRN